MRLRPYGYAWITLGLFAFPLIGHLLFGWFAYVDEQNLHRGPILVADYTIEMARGAFENWQSEFLQLLWQAGGRALFLYVGSPQSKEGDDRREAKLDAILRRVDPEGVGRLIRQIDREFERT